MASPSICFGYETALQILRTTGPRERTLLRSGAHTMPDRAPSMCAFRQALESLETLHPSMMLEQPVHLLVSRVSQCRSTSAFTVRACKTTLHGHPLSPARQRRVRKLRTPRLRAYRSPRRQHDRAARTRLRAVWLYQTNEPARRPPIRSNLSSVRSLADFAARNPSLVRAQPKPRKPCAMSPTFGLPRETKAASLLGFLPAMYGGWAGHSRMNYEVSTRPLGAHGKSCFPVRSMLAGSEA